MLEELCHLFHLHYLVLRKHLEIATNTFKMQPFFVYLLLVVFLGSFVLVECASLLSSCYPCAGSLKREWIRGVCDGTSADCGQCLEGYFGASAGPCQPSRVINIKESKIAFVHRNATINLECIFNQPIPECVWERRGYHVEISGRYQYKQKNEGDAGITDCSISITGFKYIDVGDWKCSSVATANTHSIYNINPSLHMIQGDSVIIDHHIHNHPVFVPFGESAILKCYFDKEVDCAWERRDNVIQVGGRYKYNSNNYNGKNTKECSIQIDSIKAIDFGYWVCKSMADGVAHSIIGATILLSKAESTSEPSGHSVSSPSPNLVTAARPQSHLNGQPNNAVDLNTDAIITDTKSGLDIPLIAGVAVGITLLIILTTFLVFIIRSRWKQERISNRDVDGERLFSNQTVSTQQMNCAEGTTHSNIPESEPMNDNVEQCT